MISVGCPCGQDLGKFDYIGDNNGVLMECPKCGQKLGIYNSMLLAVQTDPDDFDHPDYIIADEVK